MLERDVTVCDVTLRDGIQTLTAFVATPHKVAHARRCISAGLPALQVTSFASPKVLPQFQDAAAVWSALLGAPADLSALVPNLNGARRAVGAGVRKFHYAITATESYNRKNVGRSVDESVAELNAIVTEFADVEIVGAIGVAFGCPIEGRVPAAALLRLTERLLDAGCAEVQFADTLGCATPSQVREIARHASTLLEPNSISFHFHDTLGRGIANCYAAIEAGVPRLDASFGGLGGSPVSTSVDGNVCLEDLVATLDADGLRTGIDLEALLATADALAEAVGLGASAKSQRAFGRLGFAI